MTEALRGLVASQGLGFVATCNGDGTPNLSPKGTTAVWDDDHLVFAHIHSAGTVGNIEEGRRAVEVNVVDPILRKGYRFRGTASVHREDAVYERGVAFYADRSGLAPERIRAVVVIRVEAAAEVVSPAYDDGSSEDDVQQRFLRRLGLARVPPPSAGGALS